MRILWVSNSRRAPSGYGNQTELFSSALQEAGHKVAILAFYGHEGPPMQDADGVVTLGRVGDQWGNDAVEAYYRWWQADVVITLINPFVLDTGTYAKLNWLCWMPIEGEPVQPADVRALQFAKRIWAMCRHGENQLGLAGFKNVDYVPHGIDMETFKPVDRVEARHKLAAMWSRAMEKNIDLDGKFMVAYNAANKGIPARKGFYECFRAFAQFKQTYQGPAVLYVHTERDGRYGEPLMDVLKLAGLERDDVIFAPQHAYLTGMLSPAYLNDVYNAADCYFHPSHGEGFGLPIVEAQAAGCPVVVNGFSSMPELVFAGYSIEPACEYMHAPGMMLTIPDVNAMAQALLATANDARSGDSQRVKARAGALAYDHQAVFKDFMAPALDSWWAEQQAKDEKYEAARNGKVLV